MVNYRYFANWIDRFSRKRVDIDDLSSQNMLKISRLTWTCWNSLLIFACLPRPRPNLTAGCRWLISRNWIDGRAGSWTWPLDERDRFSEPPAIWRTAAGRQTIGYSTGDQNHPPQPGPVFLTKRTTSASKGNKFQTLTEWPVRFRPKRKCRN